MNALGRNPAGSAIWLSLLLALPLAGPAAADVAATTQTKPSPHRVVQPSAAYEVGKLKPGEMNSINPQPLPPFPSNSVGGAQNTRAAWGAPAAQSSANSTNSASSRNSANSATHSMRSKGRCRSPGASQSGNSANSTVTPEGLVTYCESTTQGLDKQLNSRMNSQSKANGASASQISSGAKPDWSATSGQSNSEAELHMLQLQQEMSQRQQAVQDTSNLLQNANSLCPPKCPE